MYAQRYHRHSNGRNYNSRKSANKAREVVSAIRAMQSAPKSHAQISEDYKPKHSFADFPLSEGLKNNLRYRRFYTPTPIQDEAINPILEGKDIIGIANTGTGKTAAFLLPLIQKVLNQENQKVLIITPTRELASQISDDLYGFAYELKISWTVSVGGLNIKKQIDDLAKHPDFVIGTPGRLKDLAQKNFLKLAEFNNVVLDEADRMVDMGFIHDIKYFIANLPTKRQSLFFSATIPPKVKDILRSFVTTPITISVKKSDTLENIDHKLIEVNDSYSKLEKLHEILNRNGLEKVLIFGRTKWGIQKLADELKHRGFNADAIHGNKNQGQRQRVLSDFRSSRISILLATDIVARGIDVSDISHVINYDLPESYEDYIHRIGRTGRAHKKGVALTFVTPVN